MFGLHGISSCQDYVLDRTVRVCQHFTNCMDHAAHMTYCHILLRSTKLGR